MSHKSNIFLFSFGGQFRLPMGVTCNQDGNIVVSDFINNRIQIFSKECEFLFSFGERGREEGQFDHPYGVTCDKDGNIIVCDTYNHRIQVFSSKGKFLFSFGSKGGEEGQFESPEGVTCDKNGNIVVSDTYNHRIQVFKCEPSISTIDLENKFTGVFLYSFGSEGKEEGQFRYPRGVTCDHDGNIIVCDSFNHRVQVFKCEPSAHIDLQNKFKGEFLFSFGREGRREGEFCFPYGVTCDHDGNIVVSDSENNRIQVFKFDPKVPIDLQSKFKFDSSSMSPIGLQNKITEKGNFIITFGSEGKEKGQFDIPSSITCDHDGNYVVCDTYNHRIQVFKGPSEVPSLFSLCWKHVDNLL
jgi:tripartite motif-containing protein 71